MKQFNIAFCMHIYYLIFYWLCCTCA